MRRSPLVIRLVTGSMPFVVVTMGLTASAVAVEHSELRLPQTYAEVADASANEPTRLHTDLGVMGEVELIRERYPDGAIKIERQVTLDSDGNYVNHGAWKMFAPHGEVVAEGQYHFGERVGLWTRWYAKNDSPIFDEFPFNQFKAPFMSQAHFADGLMEGEWIITDANDRKMNQISLQAGHRHGTSTTWLPNGKVYWQASYDQAVPTGDKLQADTKTGELQRIATYVEGRKITTRTTDYPGTRQKSSESMYLAAPSTEKSTDDFWNLRMARFTAEGDDLRHGVAKAWYPNGKIEQEGVYEFGEKSGTFTYWHENGQVAATGEFRNDQPEGAWVWWHENGQKSAIGKYEEGVLTGEWRWWNEAGKLTKQHIYDGSEAITSEDEPTFDIGLADDDDQSIF